MLQTLDPHIIHGLHSQIIRYEHVQFSDLLKKKIKNVELLQPEFFRMPLEVLKIFLKC